MYTACAIRSGLPESQTTKGTEKRAAERTWASPKGLDGIPLAPAKGPPLSPKALFQRVEAAVWVVYAGRTKIDFQDPSTDASQGSAVAVTKSLLLTNCHVLEDRPIIVLGHGETVLVAKTVSADPDTDRCVLSSVEEFTFTPVPGISRFDALAVGDPVYTVGAPKGLDRTLGDGLISGLRSEEGRHYIQTTAPISPGSSGGGLFDDRGNLIGITKGYIEKGQALNFAIAAEDYWR